MGRSNSILERAAGEASARGKSGFRQETEREPLVNQMRLWAHSRGHGVQREAASPRPRRAEQEADKYDEGGNDQLSHFIFIHIVFYVVQKLLQIFFRTMWCILKKNSNL